MKHDVKNLRSSASAGAKKRSNLCRRVLPALIAGCFACAPAWANPTGAQIVTGQVNITNNGKLLTVTNSPGSVINWQNFSIGSGELTQFLQQSASSAVLNRIVGQDPSQIFGALQSNGKVYLINPNGIMFGAGAQVNVGGLVASSLNLSNADFTAGKLNFAASTSGAGPVVNQGSINSPNGGNIYLIAPQVQNTGIITSPQGEVLLAAGHSVQLVDGGNPNLQVTISAPDDQALNLGQVIAQGGKIGIYGALVHQSGTVSANSAVVGQNGQIVFKASDTTTLAGNSQTTATGTGKGGDIYLLGNQVALTDHALVDASGKTGGGTVLIGGDFHGSNPAIIDAQETNVGKNAVVRADAIENGNGGNIAVWANNQTEMLANMSARGGTQGGNGGSAEVSGKNHLDFKGLVDLRAPHGSSGTLLLDPADVAIESPTASTTNCVGGFCNSPDGTSSILLNTDLYNQLQLGNLNVTTVGTPSNLLAPPLNGTITVSAPILEWGNANALTLTAAQDVLIQNSITGVAGTLNINAARNITQTLGNPINVANLSATATTGAVTLLEPANSVTGTISGSAAGNFGFNNGGAITVGTTGITSSTGSIGLNATNGITLNANGALTASVGNVGLLTTAGNIAESGGLGGPGISALTLTAVANNGSVTLNNEPNNVGTITGSANSAAANGFVYNTNFGFSVGAAGIVSTNGIGNNYSIALDITNAPGGNITINGPINGGIYKVLLNSYSSIVQSSANPITANYLSLAAGANIGTSGNPILTNLGAGGLAATAVGNVYINNGASPLNIYSINAPAGAVQVNSVGSLTIPSCGIDGTDCVMASSAVLTTQGAMNIANTPGFNSINSSGAITLNSGYNAGTTSYVAAGPLTVTGVLVAGAPGVHLNAGGLYSYIGCPAPATCAQNLYTPPPTIFLTVSSESASNKLYDGTTTATLSGGILTGVTPGDTVVLTQTASFASKNVGNGIAVTTADTINVTGDTSGDTYVLVQPTGLSANITPAPLTVSGQTAANKIYNGNTLASISGGTLSGVLPGDTVTLSANGNFATKNAGSNIAVTVQDSLSGADGGNYLLAQQPAGLTANITQLGIAVAAAGSSKVYNGSTTDAVTLSSNGVLQGDKVTFSNADANFADANAGLHKTVTVTGISANGADAGNYTFASTTTTVANITPATLTVNGETALNKIYDGSTAAVLSGGTLNGVVPADTSNVTLTQAGNFASPNVGNDISVIAADSLSGSGAANYTLAEPTGLMANIVAKSALNDDALFFTTSNSYIVGLNSQESFPTRAQVSGNPGTNNTGGSKNGSPKKLYCN